MRNHSIKLRYFGLLTVLLLTLFTVACQKKELTISEQTGQLEKVIEKASKGDSITEQDLAQIAFADGAKQKFLEKACLEPEGSQIISVVGLETEQQISLAQILDANTDTRQELYQSFLERQKQNLGQVQPASKRFSEIYEQDGLAYVFVEVPFQFEKLVAAGQELAIHGCTLYRAYVWQKLDNQWQFSQYLEQAYLADKDMALLLPNLKAETETSIEKFLTVFGKKVEFK